MKKNSKTIPFLALLMFSVATAFGAGPLTPPGAPAPTMKTLDEIEPRTPISALPFTISQPGSYYMTGNLTASAANQNGIRISASDVTLDMRGFALIGLGGTSGDGIDVFVSVTNVAIRNGTVRGWGGRGVDADTAFNSQLLDIRASQNVGDGMSLGAGGILTSCTARSNGQDGIETLGICTVSGCSSTLNSGNGVTAGAGSTITACSSSGNGANGILAGVGCTVRGNTVYTNVSNGIQVSTDCQVVENTSSSNSLSASIFAGIRVTGSNNRIERNSVTGNDTGLQIESTNNIVSDNTVRANADNYAIQSGNQLRLLLSQLPETIDQPANVVLAGSLIGVAGFHGITILTDDVTIDLAGHALVGVPASLNGITVAGSRTNIAIRNGTLRGWGGNGVNASSSYNSQFIDLRASGNLGNGIQAGFGAVVKGCSARGNVVDGIVTFTGSTVSDSTASENLRDGISVFTGCTVRDCAAFHNTANGIVANSGSTVIHCTAYANTNGIVAYSGSTVLGCSTRNNATNGIIVSVACTVSDCTAVNNVTGINAASDCRIVNNTCVGNDFAGIYVTSSDNRIDGNSVTDNGAGIRSNPATGNLIIRNSASGNGTHYDIVIGNAAAQILSPSDAFVATHPWANFAF